MALLAILVIAAYFASIAGVGYLIFSPFKKVIARKPLQGKRFQLTDLFAFFLSFQLGFGAINLIFPDIRWNTETALFATTVLLLITGLAWFYGLRIIWRANTTAVIKRIVLLGLIMPFGFVVSAAVLPLLMSFESTFSFFVRVVSLVSTILLLRYLGVWVLANNDHDPGAEIIGQPNDTGEGSPQENRRIHDKSR